jgi:tetratricopeptide (TPR) repeat protein
MSATAARTMAQHTTSEIIPDILRQILSLQFESADSLIADLGKDHEMGPGIIYLSNYLEFLDVLVTGDRPGYERYLPASLARLDSIQSVYGHLPGRLPLISAIHLQSSLLAVLHGDNLKAARHFYMARRTFQQAESARPGYPFNDKLEGLILLLAAFAPAEYHWLLSIFGIQGDMELGLERLTEYHEGTSGTDRLESCLILLCARQLAGEGEWERQDDCGKDTLTLHRYFHAHHALRSGNSREVIELLDAWQQDPGEEDLIYTELLLGEAFLNSSDPRAVNHLLHFLEHSHGDHFIKTAWHKLSWYHLLHGDSTAYLQARDNVIQRGSTILDADKQALLEANEDGLPNAVLLRSRLYFDGGYYRKSFETLQEINPGELAGRKDSLEYTYRLARIADRLGKKDDAIAGYREVMESGMGSIWYFPSNAALHLGIIYEAMGDTVQALKSYQTCLKMKHSVYKNSIGNKAKGGIGRLK